MSNMNRVNLDEIREAAKKRCEALEAEARTGAASAYDRRRWIGSSDAAAICGLSPWRTNVQAWSEKTGRVEPEDISGKKAVRRGAMLEPIIREIIAKEAKLEVMAFNKRYFHSTLPLAAEIDFEFELDGITCNGEIKTANSRRGWGDEWSDQIPDYYMAQVIHAQIVTGRKNTLVVAAFGFDDFRYYWVEFDEQLADWITQQELDFSACVEDDACPEPTTLEDAYLAFGVDSGETKAAAPEIVESVLLWRGLDKQIAGLTDQRDAVELTLIRTIGSAQSLTVNARPIFTFKAQNHTHLDQKGLKAEVPELVKKFTITKQIRVARAAGGRLDQGE
jgi:putative phage-type endonuclease